MGSMGHMAVSRGVFLVNGKSDPAHQFRPGASVLCAKKEGVSPGLLRGPAFFPYMHAGLPLRHALPTRPGNTAPQNAAGL